MTKTNSYTDRDAVTQRDKKSTQTVIKTQTVKEERIRLAQAGKQGK